MATRAAITTLLTNAQAQLKLQLAVPPPRDTKQISNLQKMIDHFQSLLQQGLYDDR